MSRTFIHVAAAVSRALEHSRDPLRLETGLEVAQSVFFCCTIWEFDSEGVCIRILGDGRHPHMVANIEEVIRGEELCRHGICWCFCVSGLIRHGNQIWMSARVVGEWIFNLFLCWLSIDEVRRVDVTDEVLIQDIIDILVLVDGKDVPVEVYRTASGTQDDIASRMGADPLSNVVDLVIVYDPRVIRVSIVLADFRDAIPRERRVAAVGGSIASSGGSFSEGVSSVEGGSSSEEDCDINTWVSWCCTRSRVF